MRFDRTTFTLTANGTTQVFGLTGPVGLIVAWNANVTAGTVTLETAPTGDYSGTWNTESSLTVTYSSGAPIVQTSADDLVGAVARIKLASLAGASASVDVTVIRYVKALY